MNTGPAAPQARDEMAPARQRMRCCTLDSRCSTGPGSLFPATHIDRDPVEIRELTRARRCDMVRADPIRAVGPVGTPAEYNNPLKARRYFDVTRHISGGPRRAYD